MTRRELTPLGIEAILANGAYSRIIFWITSREELDPGRVDFPPALSRFVEVG
jgi:hypothetical protein